MFRTNINYSEIAANNIRNMKVELNRLNSELIPIEENLNKSLNSFKKNLAGNNTKRIIVKKAV